MGGIRQRRFGGVNVADKADQGGEILARFGAVYGVYCLAHALGRILAHQSRGPGYGYFNISLGRTSPPRGRWRRRAAHHAAASQ